MSGSFRAALSSAAIALSAAVPAGAEPVVIREAQLIDVVAGRVIAPRVIIAVAGDPLSDVAALQRVAVVITGGTVEKEAR